jgi:Ca-activated chloride channel family protein
MDAADISDGADSISRLETAKKFMIDYISKYPENRYGIILFAGKSLISSPLTIDTEVLTNIISSLDSKSIREGGTNLEDALALSIARFSDTKDPKTVVILSDG